MPISYYALPAQTRVMRCFVAPWNEPDIAKAFHKGGDTMAFADGHVKFIVSRQQYDSFCDGPTASPARVDGNGNDTNQGDGSCNSAPRSIRAFLTCQTRCTTVKAVSAAIA